jgi:hypothetical protein
MASSLDSLLEPFQYLLIGIQLIHIVRREEQIGLKVLDNVEHGGLNNGNEIWIIINAKLILSSIYKINWIKVSVSKVFIKIKSVKLLKR